MPPKKSQFSPLPKTSRNQPANAGTMDFYDALRYVFEQGGKVTKKDWNNPEIYLQMADNKLCIHLVEDNMFHPLLVSVGDISGTDWIILDH